MRCYRSVALHELGQGWEIRQEELIGKITETFVIYQEENVITRFFFFEEHLCSQEKQKKRI